MTIRTFKTREAWAAAVSEVAAPYSWHSRTSIDGANEDAMSGDRYIGTWCEAHGTLAPFGIVNDNPMRR